MNIIAVRTEEEENLILLEKRSLIHITKTSYDDTAGST